MRSKVIYSVAVDFDGCLCENKWPEIGEENSIAINALKRLQVGGTKLILWSCREGERLQEAVEWCRERGLEFDAVNENLPEYKEFYGNDSRKVYATEYWDDKSVIVDAKMMQRFPNGYITMTWSDVGGKAKVFPFAISVVDGWSKVKMKEAARYALDQGSRETVGYMFIERKPERVSWWKRLFGRKKHGG